jgi:hypothetical protein
VELNGILKQAQVTVEEFIAIPIVVRYRVLGFEESGVRSQESGFGIQDSGVKILVYLMRLGNAILIISSV